MSWPTNLIQTVVAALVSGAVVGAILNWQFAKDLEEFRSERGRDEAVLTELVGPAIMHFARTKAIAVRYGQSQDQLFGDADLLRASNETMRDLLISKGYLIPSSLMPASQCLVVHYDIWLKRFDATVQKFEIEHRRKPLINDRFDVGFSELDDQECGGFDDNVPKLFTAEFRRLRKELYGIE